MKSCGRWLLAALALVLSLVAARAADIPYLSGRLVDDAEILSAGARARLGAALKAHEDRTTNQIAVLTVPSLDGQSIEEYAVAVFEAWKLGRRDKDNGVLVVVVPNDRRMRIEVGYGLEGALTDLAAARIIRNVMTPHFKTGDFDRGIEEGVAATVALLEGRAESPAALAIDPSAQPARGGLEVPDLPLTERILFGAFIFGIIGLFTIIGVITPGMGWFLYLFLIPFWAMFPIAIVGTEGALTLLVIYLIGFPLAKLGFARSPWYEKAKLDLATKGRARIGGFSIGGNSSHSSSWSTSSSGSSFSGGGGRSGGGGSSGSW
ncbi:MAG TPA: TPM domain-containing protein [Burkholderiales bacterium]|nr:TPM domain-containing protein [Burkholderiales bacterium]